MVVDKGYPKMCGECCSQCISKRVAVRTNKSKKSYRAELPNAACGLSKGLPCGDGVFC